MYLSLAHLKQFVNIPTNIPPGQLADIITTSIAEVEGCEIVARDGVVVAKILSVTPHPNADRLRIAQVTDGEKTFQVVCGGTNLKANQLVAFARVGAKVKWHGEGEEIILEKVSLRGVESEGMICAASEIGLKLPEGEREILDLTGKVSSKDIGKNLYEALGIPGEVIFEIDNKSLTHRPDLFGHVGFARDIACVLRNQLGKTEVKCKPYPQKKVAWGNRKLDIRIESDICQAFSSILVENITVKPSPIWLQQALLSIGVRPINNIVDITNYVMLELGQPMHAYDYDRIAGKTLIIRKARKGEKALALNEKIYELTTEDDVISDKEKSLLITGIMGCENSGITDRTTSILLEAGSWDPVLVRKMGQRLGLRSDASTRFEKDLDPHYTTQATIRAVELIKKLLPRIEITSECFKYAHHSKEPKEITLDLSYASRLLGIEVDQKQAEAILKDLGCTVKKQKTKNKKQKDGNPIYQILYTVYPPSWRSTKDLLTAEDLIEEIGRVTGYANVPCTAPEGKLWPHMDEEKTFERRLKEIMSKQLGYHEVENYSLTNAEKEETTVAKRSDIEVANPLTKDTKDFKASLIPDLLRNATLNSRIRSEFKVFETCRLYEWDNGELRESRWLAAIVVRDQRLGKKQSSYDQLIFQAKEDVDELLASFNAATRTYRPSEEREKIATESQEMDIVVNQEKIGCILSPRQGIVPDLELFDTALFEINLDALQHARSGELQAHPLPKFPETTRDIAFILDETIPAGTIEDALKQVSPLMTNVSLFDVFEGAEISEGKRSLAYHLTLRSDERTLTEPEIQEVVSSAEKAAISLGAAIRT